MGTREKILDKALEMFNERGIEYVGLRELASVLGMRVSNITYYFPTKDDLVNQLSVDMSTLNSKVVVNHAEIDLQQWLGMIEAVFRNHIQYRCLLLSFVHLMGQNKKIAMRYEKTQQNRNEAIREIFLSLSRNGYLKVPETQVLDFLVSTTALIIRFWISESAISLKLKSPEEQIHHYLQLIVQLILPYSTSKARKQLSAMGY
ncbi:MAG TPA: TetR/AcrR family transcriptional regulator [Chitinophagaceae bacterium]|nr:TetR/AcrR family transcriptional regulator [Chitinophagaceae bacterium]